MTFYLRVLLFPHVHAYCTSVIQFARRWAFHWHRKKTEGPVQVIQYLGLEIDTVQACIKVPTNKVQAACQKIPNLSSKPKATLVALQSLIGSLNFLCKAIAPGRTFLRRLIGLTTGLNKPFHTVRISKGARLDLLIWLQFLINFNGVSAFRSLHWESNEVLALFTDAAAGIGFGAYLGGNGSKAGGLKIFCSTPLPLHF